jgi:hypothetical protein
MSNRRADPSATLVTVPSPNISSDLEYADMQQAITAQLLELMPEGGGEPVHVSCRTIEKNSR